MILPVTVNRAACGTVFLLLSLCSGLPAQESGEEVVLTGHEFLSSCEQGEGAVRPTQACMRFIFGLVQTVTMLQQMEPGDKLFCIDPTAVSLEEVTGRVTAWLEQVPARLDEAAYVLVSEALNANWPCPRGDVI